MLANEDINKKIISNIYNDLLSNNPSKIGLIGLDLNLEQQLSLKEQLVN